jgi:hypothetical protein
MRVRAIDGRQLAREYNLLWLKIRYLVLGGLVGWPGCLPGQLACRLL